jgi:Ion channel
MNRPTTNDDTTPTAVERWAEETFPGYRFGVVLLLLLITFVFMACAPSGAWVRVFSVALQGLTLLAALRASNVRRGLVRLAALLVLIALISAVASLFVSSSEGATGCFYALSVLMVAGAPVAIGRALWLRPVVDLRTVMGAICIYVLLGMLFAFTYAAIGFIGSDPFFAQAQHANISEYLYFSFVTLTTVGYGDYTAADGLGRALSSLEGLAGQVYLVTIVATLVSRLPATRRDAGTGTSDTPGT